MRTMAKEVWQDNITNKKSKEQLLDQAFHYSTTRLGLKHNNFNKKKKMAKTPVFHTFADICHKANN